MSRVYRTSSQHYHFSILLTLSKSSIYYLKQLLKLSRHLSMILLSKTTFTSSCESACAAPLWRALLWFWYYSPLGIWQRAVNRQPGSRSDNSQSRSASLGFFENFEILEKNRNFDPKCQLIGTTEPDRTFPGIIISLFYQLYLNLQYLI